MGKLIVIESLDGAGSSTQIKLITEYFRGKKLKYETFHFPMYGHNQFSDLITRFLRGELGSIDEVDPYFIANMYAMDRFKFLPTLGKALKENDVVLLDRYVYSNIAYQCAKIKDKDIIEELKNWILRFEFSFLNLPYPQLNIFLNVPIEIIKERLVNKREGNDRDYLKGKQDIYEASINFQESVGYNYLKLMKSGMNCCIVDCASVSGDFGDTHWNVFTPKNLFDSYINKIDNILNNPNLEIGFNQMFNITTGNGS